MRNGRAMRVSLTQKYHNTRCDPFGDAFFISKRAESGRRYEAKRRIENIKLALGGNGTSEVISSPINATHSKQYYRIFLKCNDERYSSHLNKKLFRC